VSAWGFIFQPTADPVGQLPSFQLPSAYRQVISQSLETHLSGDPLAFDLNAAGHRIIITPIKTYRDKNGQYYRRYTMELISGDSPANLQRHGLSYGKIGLADDGTIYARDVIRGD
jgi:hypothetical protein